MKQPIIQYSIEDAVVEIRTYSTRLEAAFTFGLASQVGMMGCSGISRSMSAFDSAIDRSLTVSENFRSR
jgi:hypothetical protein